MRAMEINLEGIYSIALFQHALKGASDTAFITFPLCCSFSSLRIPNSKASPVCALILFANDEDTSPKKQLQGHWVIF